MRAKISVISILATVCAGCSLIGNVAPGAEAEPQDNTSSDDPNTTQTDGDPTENGGPAPTPGISQDTGDSAGPPGTPSSSAPSGPVTTPPDSVAQRLIPSSTIRRLSVTELTNTYERLVGFVPEAVSRIPPDSAGYGSDRVVNSQTISQSHLDAFAAAGSQAAFELVAERRLDELASACSDDIMPPAVAAKTKSVVGAMMSLDPDWAVQPVRDGSTDVELLYAYDPSAEYRNSFPAPGTYELALSVNASGAAVVSGTLSLDGVVTDQFDRYTSQTVLRSTVNVTAAGDVTLNYSFQAEDNLSLVIQTLDVTGPLDDSPASAEDRAACARALVDELTPKLYRRPITTDERTRLLNVYDSLLDAGGFTTAIQQTLTAMFSSPNFLYLVEVGQPVAGNDKLRVLDSWEVAARLSYALCEEPPDSELAELAAAGGLQSPEEVQAQAARLLAKDCAKETIRRFYQQWLGVQSFLVVAKSLDIYPTFTAEVRQGMFDEVNRYIDEMFWNENASLETFYTSRKFWPNSETDFLYSMNLSESSEQTFPSNRAGVLSLPAVLAAHSAFNESNPVKRAHFVLERLVCTELPPPSFVVAPPPPDPTITTRERWRVHSEQAECAQCHSIMDPVGFALETFDAMGQFRTEENGNPVDDNGGLPSIGFEDGSIKGGVEMAQAIGASEAGAKCFADHWLRFVLGRLQDEGTSDEDVKEHLASALGSKSMQQAMLDLFGSDTFLLRSEE